jgi:hypothetical protein
LPGVAARRCGGGASSGARRVAGWDRALGAGRGPAEAEQGPAGDGLALPEDADG